MSAALVAALYTSDLALLSRSLEDHDRRAEARIAGPGLRAIKAAALAAGALGLQLVGLRAVDLRACRHVEIAPRRWAPRCSARSTRRARSAPTSGCRPVGRRARDCRRSTRELYSGRIGVVHLRVSTRGKAPAVSFREAVLAGLAPDGGLYVPADLDALARRVVGGAARKSFLDVAIAVATSWPGTSSIRDARGAARRDALNFPVRSCAGRAASASLELFHGPTFAFKDFGARMLARLWRTSSRSGEAPLTVLVATSGDTGSAVAHAFFGVPAPGSWCCIRKGR